MNKWIKEQTSEQVNEWINQGTGIEVSKWMKKCMPDKKKKQLNVLKTVWVIELSRELMTKWTGKWWAVSIESKFNIKWIKIKAN